MHQPLVFIDDIFVNLHSVKAHVPETLLINLMANDTFRALAPHPGDGVDDRLGLEGHSRGVMLSASRAARGWPAAGPDHEYSKGSCFALRRPFGNRLETGLREHGDRTDEQADRPGMLGLFDGAGLNDAGAIVPGVGDRRIQQGTADPLSAPL